MMDEDDPEEDEIEGVSGEPVGEVEGQEDEEVDAGDEEQGGEEELVGEEDEVDVDEEEEDEDEMMRDRGTPFISLYPLQNSLINTPQKNHQPPSRPTSAKSPT